MPRHFDRYIPENVTNSWKRSPFATYVEDLAAGIARALYRDTK
jgi:hypothetical protein